VQLNPEFIAYSGAVQLHGSGQQGVADNQNYLRKTGNKQAEPQQRSLTTTLQRGVNRAA